MKPLQPGDRVAFNVKFLRNTCQTTGRRPQMRGELLSHDGAFARVRWSDWGPAKRAYLAEQWGEDYAADAETHGEMVNLGNLCRVGLNTQFAAC
jgi:hypothetical protein